jgi:outer membrane protein assembly factor BamB
LIRSLPLLVASVIFGGCTTAAELREGFVSPTTVMEVSWRQHLTDEPLIEYKPQEFAAAVSDGKAVYVGSSAGSFWAFDVTDGRVVWRTKLQGAIASRPRLSADGSTIFLGTQGGMFYALETATGKQLWEYAIKGPIETQPVVSEGMVFFTSGENRVYAVDARTGAWKWQYERESPESFTIRGYAAPMVHEGRVYVGFSDGYLACLQAQSGDVIWARSLAGEATRFVDVDSTPVVSHGMLFVASYSGGVYALDPKDGSTRWRYDVEGAGTVRVGRGRVFFSSPKWGLTCLDLEGHALWRQSLTEGGEMSPPLPIGPYVVVNTAAGGTYVANASNGRLYQFFVPGHGATAEPTTDGKMIYVLSNGGYFYALKLRS